ncbi:MAG: hypothetical protein MRY83_12775 [Flavobacteriales bacterium]|nr:hypothetical protein [Flavobacteriales bacterium]
MKNIILPERNDFKDISKYLGNLNLFGQIGQIIDKDGLQNKRNKYLSVIGLDDFIKPLAFLEIVGGRLHLSLVDEYSEKTYECVVNIPHDVSQGEIFSYINDKKKLTIVLPKNIVS